MDAENAASAAAQRELIRWQRMLLPVIVILLFGLAAFFFASSYAQYQRIETQLQQRGNDGAVARALAVYERAPGVGQDLAYIQWKTLAIQDDRAQLARFHRANAALLVSVWTRNLGFVTGMILAIVGAAFVMAKLSEAPTALEASSGPVKAALSTSSPGIILAVLGTALMMMAMTVRFEGEIREPVLSVAGQGAASTTTNGFDADGPPEDFPNANGN